MCGKGWGDDLIGRLNTYTEISPSRTGVKAFGRGWPDKDGRNKKSKIEDYGSGRYFTVTGHGLTTSQPTVKRFGPAVRELQREMAPGNRPSPERSRTSVGRIGLNARPCGQSS